MKKSEKLYQKESNSGAFKKFHRKAISKAERKCNFCPPHGGIDNAGRQERPDKHKNKNRESIRTGALEKLRRQISPEQCG